MAPEIEAKGFAQEWIAAWNSHDLDRIMSHYASNVVLTSPVVREIGGDLSGRVAGIEALRGYFQLGLKAFPDLRFELIDVLSGLGTVMLYYKNHKGTRTAEFMELDETGKVVRVVANYS